MHFYSQLVPILALVGFKMHSQARAFLQPTRANIHRYQFNSPVILFQQNDFSKSGCKGADLLVRGGLVPSLGGHELLPEPEAVLLEGLQ